MARGRARSRSEVALRVTEALDRGVIAIAARDDQVLYVNAAARGMLRKVAPATLVAAVRAALSVSRHRPTAARRIDTGGHRFEIKLERLPGLPDTDVIWLRPERRTTTTGLRNLIERYGITPREFDVLGELTRGRTNRQIAETLGLTAGTVSQYVHRIMRRCQSPNRTSLARLVSDALR